MRTVYLLRHAQPQMPGGIRVCLGRHNDPPLAPEGEAAAAHLSAFFADRDISAVGTSPLLRCRQTAALVFPGREIALLPGLNEVDCGQWEGLSFAEIRARYPELYARRGRDASIPPPGGESLAEASVRTVSAIREFLARTEGDVAVVAHSGVNRSILCALTPIPFSENPVIPMDYLQLHRLLWDGRSLTVVPWEKGSETI